MMAVAFYWLQLRSGDSDLGKCAQFIIINRFFSNKVAIAHLNDDSSHTLTFVLSVAASPGVVLCHCSSVVDARV